MSYVFVDFENVKVVDLEIFGSRTIHFTVLVEALQKNLPVDLVSKMMDRAASVQLIRLAKPGKNALDFALAYYLGQAVLNDPTGVFHLISKDKGYDSLIEHLRSRHVQVPRHDDYSTLTLARPPEADVTDRLPIPKTVPPSKPKVAVKTAISTKPKPAAIAKSAMFSFEDLRERALKHLQPKISSRPARLKTLKTHLLDHFRKATTESAVLSSSKNGAAKGFSKPKRSQTLTGTTKSRLTTCSCRLRPAVTA